MHLNTSMNQVFINPKGWVEVIWGKVIDKEGYVTAATEMMRRLMLLGDEHKDVRLLIDFSAMEKISPEAAQYATLATRDLGCKKIAGFGIKPEFKSILDLIKERSTKADTIREFQTRQEAEEWLHAD
jgi:hypothetical protein